MAGVTLLGFAISLMKDCHSALWEWLLGSFSCRVSPGGVAGSVGGVRLRRGELGRRLLHGGCRPRGLHGISSPLQGRRRDERRVHRSRLFSGWGLAGTGD